MDARKEANLSSCIHVYHVYNAINLECNSWRGVAAGVQRSWEFNVKDRYAIYIVQGPDVVGHLPQ